MFVCLVFLFILTSIPKLAGIPSAFAEGAQWSIQEVGDGRNAYVVCSYLRYYTVDLTLNNLCVQIGNDDLTLVWTVQPPIDDDASVSSLHDFGPAHNDSFHLEDYGVQTK